MTSSSEQALALTEKMQDPQPRSRKSGNSGPRSGDRGGMSRNVQVSKALSKLLRHDAVKAGLRLDEEGFADVGEVLKWNRLKSLKVTFEDIQHAVSDNSKQRFALKPNPGLPQSPSAPSTNPSDWLIRANQGHSIAIESSALLTPITLATNNVPPVVVHGTYFAFYPAILASGGLKTMTRNHIHFSTGLPEDTAAKVISGMRNDAEVLIYIDVRKSLEDGGTEWWISDNGVVLSAGDEEGLVRTRYWKKVEGRRRDVGVLWEDGREVAELPESVKSRRAPSGKAARGDMGAGRKRKGKRGGRAVEELDALGSEEAEGKVEEREYVDTTE